VTALSARIQIDDKRDEITIDGYVISGDAIGWLARPSLPGMWFKTFSADNGRITYMTKTDAEIAFMFDVLSDDSL